MMCLLYIDKRDITKLVFFVAGVVIHQQHTRAYYAMDSWGIVQLSRFPVVCSVI